MKSEILPTDTIFGDFQHKDKTRRRSAMVEVRDQRFKNVGSMYSVVIKGYQDQYSREKRRMNESSTEKVWTKGVQ